MTEEKLLEKYEFFLCSIDTNIDQLIEKTSKKI